MSLQEVVNMLTLEELDQLEELFKCEKSMVEVLTKFILIISGCDSLENARQLTNEDIKYLFKTLNDLSL